MRSASWPSSQSTPTSTAKCSRSRATPASAICSLTRMRAVSVTRSCGPGRSRGRRRHGSAGLCEDALRRPHARPELDVVAELEQDLLEARERDDDVEGAEVPAVGDAQDAALEWPLAAVGGDPSLAQQPGHLAAVDGG